MLPGISGGTQMMQLPRQDSKMTSEQSEKLGALLESYNADSLSDEDAKNLVSGIKELGIAPGADLASALGDAGIDARALAKQAGIGKGVEGGRPPPPPPSDDSRGVASVDDTAVSLIADAVSAYQNSDDETATLQSILEAAMEDANYDTSQPLISFYA